MPQDTPIPTTPAAAPVLYLEDLEPGQKFYTGKLTVEQDEMVAFARQHDPQAMHLDEEAAKDSFFGRLVGSGWQTLTLTIRLMVERKPFGNTELIGVKVDDIRFLKPLLPGMTLDVVAEILDTRPSKTKPGRGYVNMKITTRADGQPLLTQRWLVLVPQRPAA